MFDLQSAPQSSDCSAKYSADSDQTCTFQCLIPMGNVSKIPSGGHKSPSGYGPEEYV